MELSEFEKQVKPAAKRSQLEPFKEQIFELREKGYANGQIREFLSKNGLTVSTEAVRKFINSRSKQIGATTSKTEVVAGKQAGEGLGLKIGEKPKTFEHNPSPDKDKLL